MYNYSEQIGAFRSEKVRLNTDFSEKLLAHRKANRDRLISRLPSFIPGLTIGVSSFRPQGSFAMRTVIQTKFTDEEYDIDDGIVLWKHQFVDKNGNELTAQQIREFVRDALMDDRFKRQPKICSNCVRVFYADTDEEKHHVDFPIYRKYINANGKKVRELASENGWVASDPTQVNKWFDEIIEDLNDDVDGWGTQLRHMIQLLKRFCRSRKDWDMPNGMKLTMLAVECRPDYDERIDVAFRALLKKIRYRIYWDKVIRNLAHPEKPAITRTTADQNVVDFEARLVEALDQFSVLDTAEGNNEESARSAWDWIFKSEGFFAQFDADRKAKAKQKSLLEKAALVGAGARTSPYGILGSFGVANAAHGFYAD